MRLMASRAKEDFVHTESEIMMYHLKNSQTSPFEFPTESETENEAVLDDSIMAFLALIYALNFNPVKQKMSLPAWD